MCIRDSPYSHAAFAVFQKAPLLRFSQASVQNPHGVFIGVGIIRWLQFLHVSRAVANAATLEELTIPFVKKGGVAIAWKGPGVADELTASRRAAFLLGGTVRGTVDAPIPRRADWAHVLLLTDKTLSLIHI